MMKYSLDILFLYTLSKENNYFRYYFLSNTNQETIFPLKFSKGKDEISLLKTNKNSTIRNLIYERVVKQFSFQKSKMQSQDDRIELDKYLVKSILKYANCLENLKQTLEKSDLRKIDEMYLKSNSDTKQNFEAKTNFILNNHIKHKILIFTNNGNLGYSLKHLSLLKKNNICVDILHLTDTSVVNFLKIDIFRAFVILY